MNKSSKISYFSIGIFFFPKENSTARLSRLRGRQRTQSMQQL
jgi:hypothetical protein